MMFKEGDLVIVTRSDDTHGISDFNYEKIFKGKKFIVNKVYKKNNGPDELTFMGTDWYAPDYICRFAIPRKSHLPNWL